MLDELTKLTNAYFEDETHTPLDYAVAQLQSGKTIADIARSLSDAMNTTLHRETLSTYLHSLPEGTERITTAKPTQALAMIEEAITIVDTRPEDKTAVAWAMNRARVRESHAKMINPEFQQSKQQTNVQLNIGSLHLDALRAWNKAANALPIAQTAQSSDELTLPAHTRTVSDGPEQ
jgi:hypothetical protein